MSSISAGLRADANTLTVHTGNDPSLFARKRVSFFAVDFGHKVVHYIGDKVSNMQNGDRLKLIIRLSMKTLTPSVKKMNSIFTSTTYGG
jgi:hypothetical protein